jgi:hypothetical protein
VQVFIGTFGIWTSELRRVPALNVCETTSGRKKKSSILCNLLILLELAFIVICFAAVIIMDIRHQLLLPLNMGSHQGISRGLPGLQLWSGAASLVLSV